MKSWIGTHFPHPHFGLVFMYYLNNKYHFSLFFIIILISLIALFISLCHISSYTHTQDPLYLFHLWSSSLLHWEIFWKAPSSFNGFSLLIIRFCTTFIIHYIKKIEFCSLSDPPSPSLLTVIFSLFSLLWFWFMGCLLRIDCELRVVCL